MGSTNDWDVMQHAARQLKDFGVPYERAALSATALRNCSRRM